MRNEMAAHPDFTVMSLHDVAADFEAVATDVRTVFGQLDAHQINWRPSGSAWSVAQCFDHLLTINQQMQRAMDAALDPAVPRTMWQRLPLLPAMLGRVMVKSLSPQATRKLPAPATAAPSLSTIDADVIGRFAESQAAAAVRVRVLDGTGRAATVMVSPFAAWVTYSLLDAWRLTAAHQRRHFEQARRVTQMPGFPGPRS